jgi:hypothetical protein
VERLIRRYANRKLYDPSSRTTVTLNDIACMIREGEDVVVVDAVSGQDVTSATLANALVRLGRQRGYPPAWREALQALLRELLLERPGKLWKGLKQGGDNVLETVEESVTRILHQSQLATKEEVGQLGRSVTELSRLVRSLRPRRDGKEVEGE